jgi:hypothetical protein
VSACPRQLERLKSAAADPAMAAGDLVDLGNLPGHWDMVGNPFSLSGFPPVPAVDNLRGSASISMGASPVAILIYRY